MSLYVDELFDEIAQLPKERREEAIALRCAGWPMIEREVRALLSVHEENEALPQGEAELTEGARLGHFELEGLLGRGATASVWRAWDMRLQTYTALKVLDVATGLRGQQALDAVLHEARAASAIISDHVVRIKNAGRFDGGPHYIEMELCAERRPHVNGTEILAIGRSLAEVPLNDVEEKVRVVAEAARGVDAAHRAGVLHRDLKPGNILLTPVSRRAKVVDFGLAAEQLHPAPSPSVPSHRTVTVLLEAADGKVVGTPAYMPPEQAYGQPPTRATDVYALGATLYALLIGDHPYLPSDDAQVPALDVLGQVRAGPPPRLRRVTAVPRRLERIVDRAMARSARDRYATAGELADDLEAWRLGFATSVDGTAPLLRARLLVGRHRVLAASLALGSLALLVFLGALGWMEFQRRTLQEAITASRIELIASQGMAMLAEHHRYEAERATEAALQSEGDAERRWLMEVAAREEAEQQAMEAQLAQEVALEEQATLEAEAVELNAQLGQLEQTRANLEQQQLNTVAELLSAQATLAESAVQLEEERAARERAELAVSTLQQEAVAQAEAVASLGEQLVKLEQALAVCVAVPEPSANEVDPSLEAPNVSVADEESGSP